MEIKDIKVGGFYLMDTEVMLSKKGLQCVCRVNEIGENRLLLAGIVRYSRFNMLGKNLGASSCTIDNFVKGAMRRVKPKKKKEERWSDMGRVRNYSKYHGD